MAMQATHILCALELEKHLSIGERAEYLSGVVYPDSRYMCGVNRDLTHNPNLVVQDILTGSDFEKGQKVHVLYDMIQRNYIYDVFGIPHEHKMIGYSDLWFKVSALKFIEDLYSFNRLSELEFSFAIVVPTQYPNNEDQDLMAKWYELQHKVYCSGTPSIESYTPVLDWFDQDMPGAKDKISKLIKDLSGDEKIKTAIHAMYSKVMQDFYEGLGITK